jgi:hypothetical protein
MVLLFSPIGSAAWAQDDAQRRLLGTWEYRQAAGTGFDREGERLEFSWKEKSIRGVYLGLEREGEHGLFYTAVEMKNLTVGPNGEIAFVVPERDLFEKRPKSVEEARQKTRESAGFTRDELHMQGRITGGTLTLQCVSKSPSCPDRVMVFKKTP